MKGDLFKVYIFLIEECAVMALRCLALTIGSQKTKKLGSSIPYVLKVVNVSTCVHARTGVLA